MHPDPKGHAIGGKQFLIFQSRQSCIAIYYFCCLKTNMKGKRTKCYPYHKNKKNH